MSGVGDRMGKGWGTSGVTENPWDLRKNTFAWMMVSAMTTLVLFHWEYFHSDGRCSIGKELYCFIARPPSPTGAGRGVLPKAL